MGAPLGPTQRVTTMAPAQSNRGRSRLACCWTISWANAEKVTSGLAAPLRHWLCWLSCSCCPAPPLCRLLAASSFRPFRGTDSWSCWMAHVRMHQEQQLVLPRRRSHVVKKGKMNPWSLSLPKPACSNGCIIATLLAFPQPNASSWVIFIFNYMMGFSVILLFWLNIPWVWFNFLPTSVLSQALESSNEVKKLPQNLEQMGKKETLVTGRLQF